MNELDPQIPLIRSPVGPRSVDRITGVGSARRQFARRVDRCAQWADPCCRTWPRLVSSAIVIGLVPLIVAIAFNSTLHQPISALALAPLLWSCARRDAVCQGMLLLVVAFAVHSTAAIVISSRDSGAAAIFPESDPYWRQQYEWITTGRDPEYEIKNWVPAHAQLLTATTLLSFSSLGIVTLDRGFHEVDVMNYYNGRLWNLSRNGPRGLILGWHVWSVLRGVGYVLLTFEIVSLALQVFIGRQISSWQDRRRRWLSGFACLVADAGAKLLLLDVVRRQLFENLV